MGKAPILLLFLWITYMRLAMVDLFFSWPPHGGACVDVYHTAVGLQALGHDVRLFFARVEGAWERGNVEEGVLPFSAEAVAFSRDEFTGYAAASRFHRAVGAWAPEAVFLCDAFFFKPDLVEALSSYPLVSRFYAYEATCPRDFRRYKNGAICPLSYLETPDTCRRCALEGMAPEIKRGRPSAWTREFLAARAYAPAYYQRLRESLRKPRALAVYNRIQEQSLRAYHDAIHVVPGGVDLTRMPEAAPEDTARDKKIILMAGRAEDPIKGVETLRRAGEILARRRDDFEMWATHPDQRLNSSHFRAIGWQSYEDILRLNQQTAIGVVPSLWDEPFGIAAVEAMAAARPVCASAVGGLRDIVVDGETGLLHRAGDAEQLAAHLARLLDDPELRARMGQAGRARAESEYHWPRVIEKHYPPIIERLKS